MNGCIYTFRDTDLTFKTGSFIQERTTTIFWKLLTRLKYCVAHVQRKTDRGLIEDESKEDVPMLSPLGAAIGAAFTGLCVCVDLHGIATAFGG